MDELGYWPHKAYNRGRWANDLGTMNLLGPDCVRRAVDSIRDFRNLSIGSDLNDEGATPENPVYKHEMTSFGSYTFSAEEEQLQNAADRITVDIHGMVNTHIDALSHVGHRGISYNGAAFNDYAKESGVERFGILDMASIVTRGWLVDVPRQRGIEALTPGDPVLPADLAWLSGKIAPGDAVIVRTGRHKVEGVDADDPRAKDNHGNWSGLHVDCIDQIHQWDVALVGTDGPGDNFPSTTPYCSVPIHILSEGYLGMPLVHTLNLEILGDELSARDDKSFLFAVAPLRIPKGTGSPVNPTAII